MKILLIYQYFRPEVGAGIERVFYYTKHLSSKGLKFIVISGIPNYPTGKVYPGYSLRFFHKEHFARNIEVIRTFVYPTKYTSSLRRLLNYVTFTISAFLVGLIQRKSEVIVASSPPLASGIVGLILSLVKNKPLIFEVQDVWPGAAVEVGALNNKFVIKILGVIEKAIYRRAKFIVAPTQETKEILLKDNKFLNKDKVRTVLNSVDLDLFDRQKIDETLRQKLDLVGKFVVLYSGTIGLQQGVDTLVGAIKILKENSRIKFLIVGEGVDKEYLEVAKKEFNLSSLLIKDSVSYERIPSLVSICDVGVALLKKNKYQDAALAVKVFDYFAGGKPAIVSGGLAMKKITADSDSGFWSTPEDSERLAQVIVKASEMSEDNLKKMGEKGRQLTEKKYNKKLQVKEWDRIFESMRKNIF